MKDIHSDKITSIIRDLSIKACCSLRDDIKGLLATAQKTEESELGKKILDNIQKNIELGEKESIPLCQDTGMTVIFLQLGQNVRIIGNNLYDAINEGVRQGYREGYLRKSIRNPITGINTGDNTPAVIHTEIVPGDKLKIILAPKGFGSENMSCLKMLKPAQGIQGIKDFVLDTVLKAGANPCPPIIVGIGIGGTMEKAALLAKKALLRDCGNSNPDEKIAKLEKELLDLINKTGIGPQGLGGTTTALAVHIDSFPTHIAGLPVAVNIQCHVARHQSATL